MENYISMENYNSQAFTPEEVKAGLMQELLTCLFNYNKKSQDHYMDIHITTDSYCFIVEWCCVPYSHEWGGNFKFIPFDEMKYETTLTEEEHDSLEKEGF